MLREEMTVLAEKLRTANMPTSALQGIVIEMNLWTARDFVDTRRGRRCWHITKFITIRPTLHNSEVSFINLVKISICKSCYICVCVITNSRLNSTNNFCVAFILPLYPVGLIFEKTVIDERLFKLHYHVNVLICKRSNSCFSINHLDTEFMKIRSKIENDKAGRTVIDLTS
jgi:hypothetical protein